MDLIITTAESMELLGKSLGIQASTGIQIHLSGELGAGKTTIARGFLYGLGYKGKVKSPTYTLVEPYKVGSFSIFHFDFYRINSPEEVESMGYRDYLGADTIFLIEWPERAGKFIDKADLHVEIKHNIDSRVVKITALSPKADALISEIPVSISKH